jgi:hypothetical protein
MVAAQPAQRVHRARPALAEALRYATLAAG